MSSLGLADATVINQVRDQIMSTEQNLTSTLPAYGLPVIYSDTTLQEYRGMLRETISRYYREFHKGLVDSAEPAEPTPYNRRHALKGYRGYSDQQCELLWSGLDPILRKIYNCMALIEVTVCIKGCQSFKCRVNADQENVYLGQLLTAVYGGCVPSEFIPALVYRVRSLLEDYGARCITTEPQDIIPLRVLGIISYQDFASMELVTDMITRTLHAARSD